MTFYHCDGLCCLHYDNGDVEQSVDLHTVEWCYAACCRKTYHIEKPKDVQLSALTRAAAAELKTSSSSLHKVKGFVDDLTVIFSNVDSHQVVLRSLVLRVGDICCEFQPAKCVSLHFNGHRVVPSTQLSMSSGNTVNTCSINCTKFLGKTIGISLSDTFKLASAIMK